MLSLSGTVLDVAVLGNYQPIGQGSLAVVGPDDWSGVTTTGDAGIIRRTVWDTNTDEDFVPAEVCRPTTIGSLNDGLPVAAPNGGLTALQSQLPNTIECSFDVTVVDNELPQCGAYEDYVEYSSADAEAVFYGDCIESTIFVDGTFDIADINVYLNGSTDAFGNLTVNLISPTGTIITLADQICGNFDGFDVTLDSDVNGSIAQLCVLLNSGGSLRPIESLETFNGEPAMGNWTLQIGHSGGLSTTQITLLDWSLQISGQDSYFQEDVSLDNDPGVCGASFDWTHPVLFDNCPGGTMELILTDESDELISSSIIAAADWGGPASFVFPVGSDQCDLRSDR